MHMQTLQNFATFLEAIAQDLHTYCDSRDARAVREAARELRQPVGPIWPVDALQSTERAIKRAKAHAGWKAVIREPFEPTVELALLEALRGARSESNAAWRDFSNVTEETGFVDTLLERARVMSARFGHLSTVARLVIDFDLEEAARAVAAE